MQLNAKNRVHLRTCQVTIKTKTSVTVQGLPDKLIINVIGTSAFDK